MEKILLVDDDRSLRDSIRRSLYNEPYQLLTAADAIECLNCLKEQKIDVVVCDQRMPGIQGLDLLAHIKQAYPNTVRIMLSGNMQLVTAKDAVNQCEVFRLLTKPCSAAELSIAIRDALEHHKLLLSSRKLLSMLYSQCELAKTLSSTLSKTKNSSNLKTYSLSLESHDIGALIDAATGEVEQIDALLKSVAKYKSHHGRKRSYYLEES